MERQKLTDIQFRTLEWVVEYFAEHMRMPSIHEAMERFGWKSTGSPKKQFDTLIKKGWLTPREGKRAKVSVPTFCHVTFDADWRTEAGHPPQ